MKICIDIQSVITSPAGVGRYSYQLVRALSELQMSEDIQVSLSFFDFKQRYKGGLVKDSRFQNKAVRFMPGMVYNALWKKFHWPPLNWLVGNYDVYHFPNFNLPPLTKGKKIITVHDVAFVHYPQYIEPKNLVFLKSELPRSLQNVDKIIAVSNFTKEELLKHFNVAEEKVVVVYEGIGKNFKESIDAEIRTRYKLSSNYILSVGTLEPRKNLVGLIEAFAGGNFPEHKLVIAGAKGWFYKGIFQMVKEMNLEDRVNFLGYIPEADLPAIYSMADVFVYPSYYEGFGLPPLEAMACGVPVVSSHGGSLPEVLGAAAVLVELQHPAAILDGIKEALDNKSKYIVRGKQQVEKYSWRAAAEQTLNIYKNV